MNTKLNKQTLTIIGAVLLVATLVVGYQLYINRKDGAQSGVEKLVTNKAYGISFSYREGEDAFTLVEPPENQAGIHKSYIILPTKAYNEYKESEDAREAPAGLNVFILTLEEEELATTSDKADRMTRLKEWAVKHDGLTQFSQKKAEPEEVEIDSLKALRYQADGLYQQTIYLATYKNKVYVFVGQYNETSDLTYSAFDTLLATVSFD
ncbi:MAG: hypothetical protein AAB618_03235 [Patescibacteria group bacterium]